MGERNWEDHDPEERHDKRAGSDGDEVTRRSRIEHRPNRERRGTWLAIAIGVLGLWVLAEPLVLDVAAAELWNAVLVGAALVLAGAYNYYRRSNEEFGSAGVATLAAAVGLWLAASPLFVGPGAGVAAATTTVGAATGVLVGLVVAGLGIYSAVVIRDRRRAADARDAATYDRSGH